MILKAELKLAIGKDFWTLSGNQQIIYSNILECVMQKMGGTMMIYIPSNWIKDRKNEEKIRMLISENLGCIKLNESSQKVEDRLRELGELKILEEFRKGTFVI